MSDEAVNTAIAALASADLRGRPVSAEALSWKAALRRRLERAARGPAVLEKGLPAVVAGVSVTAAVFAAQLLRPDQSPVLATAAAIALAMLVVGAAATAIPLFARR
jgi:Ni/Fe-hydrogenase subunit HybB-like protein